MNMISWTKDYGEYIDLVANKILTLLAANTFKWNLKDTTKDL